MQKRFLTTMMILVAGAGSLPVGAYTKSRRISPAVCQPDDADGSRLSLTTGLSNSGPTGSITVLCPITTDEGFQVQEPGVEARVWGANPSGFTRFQVCRGAASLGIAMCSSPAAPPTYFSSFALSASAWAYVGSQSPYLYVTLGQGDVLSLIRVNN